ncbi:hypothetical protein BGZ81_010105 [Podila clonocystis]|nr:hypothetical protein BGZ81_010105 [Podila clonocystis]
MNQIVFDCLVTDPEATTYYGLLLYRDIWNIESKVFALLKSNANPSGPENLTWTVASKINFLSLAGQTSAINGTFFPYQYSCAVSSKGVFVVLLSDYPVPRMFQYDPNGKKMDDSFQHTGPGAWSNATIEVNYPAFKVPSLNRGLTYINAGAKETLVHSYIYSESIYLGVFNEATSTLTHAATWLFLDTMIPMRYGSLAGVVIDGNQLYAFVKTNFPNPKTDAFFVSVTPSAATATVAGECFRVNKNIYSVHIIVPISNGKFALLRSGGVWERMQAVILTGPSAGLYYDNVTIHVNDSIDESYEAPPAKTNVGIIVGVAAAVVILLGGVIGFIIWRKRSKKRAAAPVETVLVAPDVPSKDGVYSQGIMYFQKVDARGQIVQGEPNFDHQSVPHPGFSGGPLAPR